MEFFGKEWNERLPRQRSGWPLITHHLKEKKGCFHFFFFNQPTNSSFQSLIDWMKRWIELGWLVSFQQREDQLQPQRERLKKERNKLRSNNHQLNHHNEELIDFALACRAAGAAWWTIPLIPFHCRSLINFIHYIHSINQLSSFHYINSILFVCFCWIELAALLAAVGFFWRSPCRWQRP